MSCKYRNDDYYNFEGINPFGNFEEMNYSGNSYEASPFEIGSTDDTENIFRSGNIANEPSASVGIDGTTNGQVRRYTNNYNINGRNYPITNRNYYTNYYNRYNNYNVTNVNHVKGYVRDYNIYRYDTQTINEGIEYLGATNIRANDDIGSGFNGLNSGFNCSNNEFGYPNCGRRCNRGRNRDCSCGC